MTDLAQLERAILQVPLEKGRRIIAIVGPPASGKSTLAEHLAQRMQSARVLPMDGFHRDNTDLDRHGLRARKGAPQTFDVAGFEKLLRAIRVKPNLAFPTFDRASDSVVQEGGHLSVADETILVEGNYLLLKTPPWTRINALWDLSIMLNVSPVELERRLVSRWLEHGHSAAEALARARGNDLPNALFMLENSAPADITVLQD